MDRRSKTNDLYDEALKQEVIYLHSLWHQGPPTRNRDPTRIQILNQNPNPRPIPNFIPPSDLHLTGFHGPVRTQFRSKSPMFHHPYKRPGPAREDSRRSPEWPVNNHSQSTTSVSGWREIKPGSGQNSRSVSASEHLNISATKLQTDVLQTCREFFSGRFDVGGDNDGGDEDYLLESDGFEENGEFKFFSRLFGNNGDLKGYYEKNYASGEFHCLVCGGTGEKIGRKFKSCLAVVQHSLAIYKTEMTKAHRAFAQVVCDFLGWDINNAAAGNVKETQSLSKEDGSSKQDRSDGVTDSLVQGSGSSTSVNVEWPSWRPLKPQETSETNMMSEEEQASITMVRMQKKVSEACKKFLIDTPGSDDEAEEGDSDSDPINEDVLEESKEFKFFLKVFLENNELRRYYEKNYETGDFVCLVCAGTGTKVWKRFKGCSGLLQHSATLLNTKKKRAHRAFAWVVCKVFGWDFDRLPLIAVKGCTLTGSILPQNEGTLTNTKEVVDESKANKTTGRC